MNIGIYYDKSRKQPKALVTDSETIEEFAKRDLDNDPEQPVVDFIKLDKAVESGSQANKLDGLALMCAPCDGQSDLGDMLAAAFLHIWLAGKKSTWQPPK